MKNKTSKILEKLNNVIKKKLFIHGGSSLIS